MADSDSQSDMDQQTPSSPSSRGDESIHQNVAPERKTRRRPDIKTLTEEQTDEPVNDTTTVSQGGWGYWGNWGKTLISSATATVASVGQGIAQVIEKAETTLGIPSPTDVSAQITEEEKEYEQREEEMDSVSVMGGAMGMFSSLSNVVQNTGKTVITGGLDALEFIGKKTMDVIAEGDPGFKKTKGLMIRTSTLSQVLREAKEREERQTAEEIPSDRDRKAHYGMLFDEFQGLSHLEALEILSRESEAKVKSVLTTMSGEELAELREELERMKKPFSLVEFDDEETDEKQDEEFVKELTDSLAELHVSVTADKLSKVRKSACERITELRVQCESKQEESATEDEGQAKVTVEEVHSAAIRSLAELTARSMEQLHKVAELVLHGQSQEVSAEEQAKALSQITILLCKEISFLSKKFTSCLTTVGCNERGEVLNPLITGVFLEASNSASYIQDAFQLLLPVLELSHIQRKTQP